MELLYLVAKGIGYAALVFVFTELVLALDIGKRWRLRHIPGPPALPFLGALPQIIRMGSPKFFRECRAKYGPIFKVAFGRSWMVVVAEPELLRLTGSKLLNHSLFRGLLRGEFAQLDDLGLVAARDDYWRLVRSAWQPAFSAASLSGYLPRMVGCAAALVGRLESLAQREGPDGRVDLWRELGAMTLQVVGSTAYGVDFHAIEGTETQEQQQQQKAQVQQLLRDRAAPSPARSHYGRVLVDACRDVFRYSSIAYGSKYSRVGLLCPELRPVVSRLAYALPDMPFRKMLQARAALRDSCVELIRGWRAAGGASSAPAAAAAANGSANGHGGAAAAGGAAANEETGPAAAVAAPGVSAGSFLGLLLSARDKATGEGLTDPQITAQVQTFILAGYETTANALAFAVYCVANNPEVEARMVEEIRSVLGPDRLPAEADLSQLPYTEAVFNEAMRLYPPAHGTNRHVDKGPFQVGGYNVPADTPLFLSIFASHHAEELWPRAEEFIPERFLPSSPLHPEVCSRAPHAYLPFGVGSRMCIGWKFAMQEAKVALACLYQRLTFELEPGQVPLRTAVGITLSPRDGVWVRPRLRA